MPLAPDPQNDLVNLPMHYDNDDLSEAEDSVSDSIQEDHTSSLPEAYQRFQTHAWSMDGRDHQDGRGAIAGYYFDTLDMGPTGPMRPRIRTSRSGNGSKLDVTKGTGTVVGPSNDAAGASSTSPSTQTPEYRYAINENGDLVDMLRIKQETPQVFERAWSSIQQEQPSASRSTHALGGSDRSSGSERDSPDLPASSEGPPPVSSKGFYLRLEGDEGDGMDQLSDIAFNEDGECGTGVHMW